MAAAGRAVLAAVGAFSLRRIVGERDARRARPGRAERRAARPQRRAARPRQRNDELVLLQARDLLERDPTAALAWLKQIRAGASLWAEAREVAVEAASRGPALHVWRAAGDYATVAFSPDGRRLASSGLEGRVQVRELAGGATTYIDAPGVLTGEAAFAADGRMVAAASDGSILLWPPGGGAPRLLGRVPGPRVLAAIARDGSQVAAISDVNSAVQLWDTASGAVRALPGGSGGAREVVFSADGRRLATASIDRVVRVWDLPAGTRRDLEGADVVSRMAFAPDGERLLAAELNGIREWTLASGAGRVLPFPRQRFIAVAFSPDGGTVAAAGFDGPIFLLDAGSGEVASLQGHQNTVTDLQFSPDGRLLASTARDHTVRVWRLPERRGRIVGQVTGAAYFPVFSPDGSALAAGDGAGVIRIWPLAGGPARTLAGHREPVFDVELAPGGALLASQSKDRTVRLWDLASGRSRVVATTAAWVDYGRIRFSPDGRFMACSLDLQTLAVIDTASGARVCTFTGAGYNLAHDFAPDGAAIAFTFDEEVRLRDLAGCAERTLYRHDGGRFSFAVKFSPDGSLLASASDDGTVGLYDVASGQARRLRGHTGDVFSVVFSPDGRILASGGADQTVRLWDVAGGTARVLRGHQMLVAQVAFSPDGRTVASSSLDRTIRLWDIASGADTVLRGHRDKIPWHRLLAQQQWAGVPAASTAPCGCGRPTPAGRFPSPPQPPGLARFRSPALRIGADDRAAVARRRPPCGPIVTRAEQALNRARGLLP